jgi:hypothetical protein
MVCPYLLKIKYEVFIFNNANLLHDKKNSKSSHFKMNCQFKNRKQGNFSGTFKKRVCAVFLNGKVNIFKTICRVYILTFSKFGVYLDK